VNQHRDLRFQGFLRHSPRWIVISVASLTGIAAIVTLASFAPVAGATSGQASAQKCSAGAHTLSGYGSVMYPETGNGGYTSIHTDVYMVYDAVTNDFLPGNHVTLTDHATQCLTNFSLDFERSSANIKSGPHMTVNSVIVNGSPARFAFVQPTYPGDPHGQNDPNPAAHQVSQTDPVGGPDHNRLPPACSPELSATSQALRYSQDGQQCPANKLVITPASPLADGASFTVVVAYTGRPGVHNDGDGEAEGWYRTSDGGFVESEPLGTEDWMPLNNYPTSKPTYDFYDTVARNRTAVANGVLISTKNSASSKEFPNGSSTWHWASMAPVASYLVENSVGAFVLSERSIRGMRFYEVQDRNIPADRESANQAIMKLQPNITLYESNFLGIGFPFVSDGVIVSTADINSAEEMQTMIAFGHGVLGRDTLYHENMHQWWGDHVTEGGYSMTFYKEGMATLGQYLLPAREAEDAAGGPHTAKGIAAFNQTLVNLFDRTYNSKSSYFWVLAPSRPSPFTLWNDSPTYARPAAAYIALRQILGPTDFAAALDQIQRQYGGRSITEAQLEAAFADQMPNKTEACSLRLVQFFKEWFDTAYSPGGATLKPQITGPALDGPNFYDPEGGCS